MTDENVKKVDDGAVLPPVDDKELKKASDLTLNEEDVTDDSVDLNDMVKNPDIEMELVYPNPEGEPGEAPKNELDAEDFGVMGEDFEKEISENINIMLQTFGVNGTLKKFYESANILRKKITIYESIIRQIESKCGVSTKKNKKLIGSTKNKRKTVKNNLKIESAVTKKDNCNKNKLTVRKFVKK